MEKKDTSWATISSTTLVFFSKICDFVVKRVLNFRLRFNMLNYAVSSITRFFITGRENANVILSKRQRCERRNFRKIAIVMRNFLFYERKTPIFTIPPRGDGPPILANLVGNLGTLYCTPAVPSKRLG